MTIGTNSRTDAVGNGGVKVYPYTYKIFAATDLRVTVLDTAGVETVLSNGVHYTVDGVGHANGGNVTLIGTTNQWQDAGGDLLTGFKITIRRVREISQTTDIRNQGSYRANTIEDTFDHTVMLIQQQQDELSRSLRVAETASDVDVFLPTPLPGSALGWTAGGLALTNIALATGTNLVDMAAPGGSALIGFIHAETGAVDTNAQAALRNMTFANQFTGFPAIIASRRKIRLRNEVMQITPGTVISERTSFEGEGDQSILEISSGDGFDLNSISSSLYLQNLLIRNATAGTRGKLVKVSYNDELIASVFDNVWFEKASHHIDTDNGRPAGKSVVGWIVKNCYFGTDVDNAFVVSRKYGAAWKLQEQNNKTKGGNRGIEFNHNISTLSITGGFIELQQLEAIKFFLSTNATMEGAELIGVHFEANGQGTPTNSIILDGDPATAAIFGLHLLGCTEFAPTTTPTFAIPTPANVTNIMDFRVDCGRGFTFGAMFNGTSASSSKYRTDFPFKSASSVKRQLGVLSGNDFVQIDGISISQSEAHRVQVYAAQDGSGGTTVVAYQEFVVWRDVSGAINVVTIHDTATSGEGCRISTATPVYSVLNKSAMSNTFQPYIVIDKI